MVKLLAFVTLLAVVATISAHVSHEMPKVVNSFSLNVVFWSLFPIQGPLNEEQKSKMIEIKQQCAEELKLSPDDINKMKSGETTNLNPSHKVKCYILFRNRNQCQTMNIFLLIAVLRKMYFREIRCHSRW